MKSKEINYNYVIYNLEIIKSKISELNSEVAQKFVGILERIMIISSKYPEFMEEYTGENTRFQDYFDSSMDLKYNIETFTYNYPEKNITNFSFYSIIKIVKEIIELIKEDEYLEIEEDLEISSDEYEYMQEELDKIIDKIEEKIALKEAEMEDQLPFLNEKNMFKIYFTGLSLDEISDLPKNVIMQLIHKLNTPLSTEQKVPLTEGVDHVRDAYDFPLMRIQFANDYRIAYIRIKNVTAIIGVGLKTGKNINYTKYDSVAKRKYAIYEEIENYIKGNIPMESDHYKVIQILQEVYTQRKNKGQTP